MGYVAVGMLNPLRDKNEGGEGNTPVTAACPELENTWYLCKGSARIFMFCDKCA